MERKTMNQNTCAVLLTAVVIALPPLASAADQSLGQVETLTDFVQQKWKLQNFQLGRSSVLSTVPLRVSTYSSPPFIHRGQLENLRNKSQELAGLCERQGGQWRYLGPPMPDKPELGRPLPPSPATFDAIDHAPSTEAGMRAIAKIGEQGAATDVWKQMAQAMLKQPDQMVADALEYAMRQKWLGRFECKSEAAAWSAGISYEKWANRSDRGAAYKDVTLEVKLAQGK
jgi:hypothetical protein